ncbi:hypothetical protein [Rhodovarius crocodyli]|uniref:hypothetical protein n=1 Tax=Rhodovarius crocodyli TaxID=1979269 RepID=UPI0013E3B6DC|nr:hypothetical protein [Rhodovarius crocodyli]
MQEWLSWLAAPTTLFAFWAIVTALTGFLVALTPGRPQTFRTVAPDPIWRIRRSVSEVMSRHHSARIPEDTMMPNSNQHPTPAEAAREAERIVRCRANDR